MWIKAYDGNETAWEKKTDTYMDEGMSEQEARIRAADKLKQQDVKAFLNIYGTMITSIRELQHGPVHSRIMQDVDNFIENGYGERISICMALNKNRPVFEGMWQNSEEKSDNRKAIRNPNESDPLEA